MSKIPTAEEFFVDEKGNDSYYVWTMKQDIIEFTKLHVQQALKTALEEIPYGGSDEIRYEDVVHILNCYPESNIK